MISTNKKGLIEHLFKDKDIFRIYLILFLRMGIQWPYGPGEACQGFAENKEEFLMEICRKWEKKTLKCF